MLNERFKKQLQHNDELEKEMEAFNRLKNDWQREIE